MPLENGTNCQKIIYDELEKVFRNLSLGHIPRIKVFSILGAAGVGKSWLTAQIVKMVVEMRLRCFLSTPTHKAVRVLREMIIDAGLGNSYRVDSGTIHSFLNLKVEHSFDTDDDVVDTKPKLVKNTHVPPEGLKTCDILFVDEASMVDHHLYSLTMEELDNRCRIIIFIGDYFQLPPVGGNLSPIFFEGEHNKVFNLVETVRQKADSYIINRAGWLKHFISTQQFPATILDLFTTEGEMEVFDSKIEGEHQRFIDTYFADKDHTKIVGTYTNKLVDDYNLSIRNIELNYPTESVVEGERLVVQSPYEDSSGNIIFNSNQEIVCVEVNIKSVGAAHYKYYRISDEDGNKGNVLHEDSVEQYKADLESQLQLAKSMVNVLDKKERSRAWSKYFKLLSKFLNVKSSYSSTIHKLQGSTYENTYLDLRTVPQFYYRNPDLMCRLLYVGITRPSNKLYILI